MIVLSKCLCAALRKATNGENSRHDLQWIRIRSDDPVIEATNGQLAVRIPIDEEETPEEDLFIHRETLKILSRKAQELHVDTETGNLSIHENGSSMTLDEPAEKGRSYPSTNEVWPSYNGEDTRTVRLSASYLKLLESLAPEYSDHKGITFTVPEHGYPDRDGSVANDSVARPVQMDLGGGRKAILAPMRVLE